MTTGRPTLEPPSPLERFAQEAYGMKLNDEYRFNAGGEFDDQLRCTEKHRMVYRRVRDGEIDRYFLRDKIMDYFVAQALLTERGVARQAHERSSLQRCLFPPGNAHHIRKGQKVA